MKLKFEGKRLRRTFEGGTRLHGMFVVMGARLMPKVARTMVKVPPMVLKSCVGFVIKWPKIVTVDEVTATSPKE